MRVHMGKNILPEAFIRIQAGTQAAAEEAEKQGSRCNRADGSDTCDNSFIFRSLLL